MKKTVFLLLAIFIFVTGANAQWYITPTAGFSIIKTGSYKEWNGGFKSGLGVEYQFSPNMSINSGVFYSVRGDYGGLLVNEGIAYLSRRTRHFLQLPIMYGYSFPLKNGISLHFGVGPYVAASVHDKWNSTFLVSGYYFGDDISKGVPEVKYKKFDWGMSTIAGIEINNWVCNLGYDLSLGGGLTLGDVNANYHTLNLSVGYRFMIK